MGIAYVIDVWGRQIGGAVEEHEKIVEPVNTSKEVENWIFSLTPVGVVFVFYVVFVLQSEINNTNQFISYGAAAGFVGLESYWIVKGWQRKCKSTVAMGFIGIMLTLLVLYSYLSYWK